MPPDPAGPIPDTGDDTALLDLIPLGPVDPMTLSIVAAHLQSVLGLRTRALPARPRPEAAYLPTRKQLDASKIIAMLAAEKDGAPFRLGLTPYDLCIPILTYVYGESQLGGRAAVVSLRRLTDPNRQKTFTRIAKISIHEVGHLFGLEHCWQAGCLMRFSKQIDQLDRLSAHFCPACEYEVARRLKTMPTVKR